MNAAGPVLSDAVLRDVLARRAEGTYGGADLLDDVMTIVRATSQERVWPLRLPRLTRPPIALGVAGLLLVAILAGVLLAAGQLPRRVPTALPPVTGPAGNGRIVFAGDGNIYVGDPRTGNSEALVSGLRLPARSSEPQVDAAPVFSPDGTHIAFWRVRTPAEDSNRRVWDIVVVRADGSDARVVTPDGLQRGPGDFVWTADSRSLVVTQVVGVPGPQMALSLLDAAGVAAPRPLRGDAPYSFAPAQVAWFLRPPSGDRVLEVRRGTDSLGTHSAVLDIVEVALDWAGSVCGSAWSPDASKIAFVVCRESVPTRLYVANADGTETRLLDGDAGEFAWSPDGTQIAFERWRLDLGASPGGPYGGVIVVVDADDGVEHVFDATASPAVGRPDGRDGPFEARGWIWSPDGHSILFAPTNTSGLFRVDVETGIVRELPWDSDSAPSWQRVAAS